MSYVVKNVKSLFFLIVLVFLVRDVSAACLTVGSKVHVTFQSTVNLSVPANTKARDYLGSYSFTMDAANSYIAECAQGSNVYAYATYSESSGIKANFFDTIDGRPTYYASAANPRFAEYAYALEIVGEGYFTSAGTVLPREGSLYGPDVRLHLYAAVDNPTNFNIVGFWLGTILLQPYNPSGGSTRAGYSYTLKANITGTPASCEVNTDNLLFRMPTVPISAFPPQGTPADQYSATQRLEMACQGKSQFTISMALQAANGTESISGVPSILKLGNSGESGVAEGVGYVLSAPLVDSNDYLVVGAYRDIARSVQGGNLSIPIKAQYYRYASAIKPGLANTSAQFTIEFR